MKYLFGLCLFLFFGVLIAGLLGAFIAFVMWLFLFGLKVIAGALLEIIENQ